MPSERTTTNGFLSGSEWLSNRVAGMGSADTVRNLQGALRARYEPDDWREVIQPINDELRDLQRDALVTYVRRSWSPLLARPFASRAGD